MDNKNKIQKYATQYMNIGMCLGISGGLILGNYLYPDNISRGMCYGIPIGMLIGTLIGRAKDKRLSENIMTIKKIEHIQDSTDVVIYVSDKNEKEKKYTINSKKMQEEKFVEGDRVAEETDGLLVSLENK